MDSIQLNRSYYVDCWFIIKKSEIVDRMFDRGFIMEFGTEVSNSFPYYRDDFEAEIIL